MQFNTMPHFWFDYVEKHPIIDKDAADDEIEAVDENDEWSEEDDLANMF